MSMLYTTMWRLPSMSSSVQRRGVWKSSCGCRNSWNGGNVNTDPELAECIMEYVQGRGQESMEEIVQGAPERFNAMGRSQY